MVKLHAGCNLRVLAWEDEAVVALPGEKGAAVLPADWGKGGAARKHSCAIRPVIGLLRRALSLLHWV